MDNTESFNENIFENARGNNNEETIRRSNSNRTDSTGSTRTTTSTSISIKSIETDFLRRFRAKLEERLPKALKNRISINFNPENSIYLDVYINDPAIMKTTPHFIFNIGNLSFYEEELVGPKYAAYVPLINNIFVDIMLEIKRSNINPKRRNQTRRRLRRRLTGRKHH